MVNLLGQLDLVCLEQIKSHSCRKLNLNILTQVSIEGQTVFDMRQKGTYVSEVVFNIEEE